MITLEEWAEVRRLHRAEGVPIKEIARRLGLARNTVRAALRADAPPSRERGPRGSIVDAVEPQVRALLAGFPRMPSTASSASGDQRLATREQRAPCLRLARLR